MIRKIKSPLGDQYAFGKMKSVFNFTYVPNKYFVLRALGFQLTIKNIQTAYFSFSERNRLQPFFKIGNYIIKFCKLK